MTNKVEELINTLDPTKVQCIKCNRSLNNKEFSIHKYWIRANPFTTDKRKSRWTCNRCRRKDHPHPNYT